AANAALAVAPDVVASIGLLGEAPAASYDEAAAAFEAGELESAVALATSTVDALEAATDRGRERLLVAAVIVAGGVLAALVVRRRRRTLGARPPDEGGHPWSPPPPSDPHGQTTIVSMRQEAEAPIGDPAAPASGPSDP
ncbi:MAG TPA: hypothetical protein VFX65_00005, partial [Candidatus Limnocylindrales bacterium]|nr:hypothetical protein [Candidatus Limnocylindrales bacterium]